MGEKQLPTKQSLASPTLMEKKLLEIIPQRTITSNNTLCVRVVAPGHVALTRFKADTLAISGTLGSSHLLFQITKQEELNEDIKKLSNSSCLSESFVAGWLIEKWRRHKDVNVLAGQQVPLDNGAPGAVVRVLQEQELLRGVFFSPVIIYTPEKAR